MKKIGQTEVNEIRSWGAHARIVVRERIASSPLTILLSALYQGPEGDRRPWVIVESRKKPKGMTNQLWGDRTMQNKLGIIAVALAVVLFSSTLVLAQAAKASGTVVVVEKEVVQIKGADGKTYQVKMVDVMEKNLKTGDMVEYEVVEGKPMKVAKKKM